MHPSPFIILSSAMILAFSNAATANLASRPKHSIQLYGGKSNYDGGLFVQTVDGQWQHLCLQWDYADLQVYDQQEAVPIAQVICRSLGFRTDKAATIFYEYHPQQHPNSSTDFVTVLYLKCQGNESQISECHSLFQEVNISRLNFQSMSINCVSGIACGDDPRFSVTLKTPHTSTQPAISKLNETGYVATAGILEVTAFGMEGPVCASPLEASKKARMAKVACHAMGVRTNASFQGIALLTEHFGYLPDFTCLMPDTTCNGREQNIADCNHRKLWGSSWNRHGVYYGEEVSIACLTKDRDGLQLTTGGQLDNDTIAEHSVFIKYGSLWLPLVASSDPYTCRAICNALRKEGPSTAICQTSRTNSSFLNASSDYAAYIYCNSDETNVNHCAYSVDWISTAEDDALEFEFPLQVHARCIPLRWNSTSDFELKLIPFNKSYYNDTLLTGCLQASLDDKERFWLVPFDISLDAQVVAQLICQRIYPTNNVYASYINFDNLATTAERRQLGLPNCPTATAVISCQTNAKSISECAIQRITQSRDTWFIRREIGIICAPQMPNVFVRTAHSIYSDNALMELGFGSYRALISIDGWNNIAASVACRQKGFNDTKYHRAVRTATVLQKHEWLMTNVNCTGSEKSLLECKHEWKAVSLPHGSYVAGVVCTPDQSKVEIVPLRNLSNSGYASIRFPGMNSTERFYFCSVSFSVFGSNTQLLRTEAVSDIAFCRAAGYPRTKNAVRLFLSDSDVPNSNGQVAWAFNNFMCYEKDSPLEECAFERLITVDSCPKPKLPSSTLSLALALRCDEYEFGTMVRLVGGATPYDGHVEVMYKGEWGAVCDDRFDIDASTVVCRQLFGPNSQGKPVPGSKYTTKNERFLLDEVRCSPTDKSLAECAHNVWDDHDCGPSEQIGVICSKVNFIRQPRATIKTEGGKRKLVCAAEGQPPPSYQWFTTGIFLMAAGDRVDVVCQELDEVQYTCNAFNDAGESFVQVVVDRETSCNNETALAAEMRVSESLLIIVTGLGVGLGILLLMLLAAGWKIITLRKALREDGQPVGESKNMSFAVLRENSIN